MRREARALLWDVSHAAAKIAEFIDGIDEARYAEDDLRRSAVERQLEIVGEALRRLRDLDGETAEAIPDLHRIIGLRNILAHGYAVVDDSVVYAAARRRVPELRTHVEALLARGG